MGSAKTGSDKVGTWHDGQGAESGNFGVGQAAAKQAALGWPGEEEILTLVRQWGREALAGWVVARRVPGNLFNDDEAKS